ncbi:hypothetical protein [Bifidobacterium eulemuris]|uniref:Uncharacterized protein n=1 Tax=Bifidobacterium eulemuris TaxID=1765219 RepID=A0A7L9SMU4_9BIFI|nr:hypothetical protein [Bifidobacterium eulemuris]QOL31678.1 hypothetical protein BE0216_03780 [Bifidobacterium eulemuris]
MSVNGSTTTGAPSTLAALTGATNSFVRGFFGYRSASILFNRKYRCLQRCEQYNWSERFGSNH